MINLQRELPPTNWLALRGGFVLLDPGEVGYYTVVVEGTEGTFVLSLTFSSTNDPNKAVNITLTTTVKDLGDFYNLPRNSAIKGKVYDSKTKKPIPNAEIKLYIWNVNWFDSANTSKDGSYYIKCLSYEYMKEIHDKYNTRNPPCLFLEVHAKGYRSYYEGYIKPPEGGVLVKDIYLEKLNASFNYKLAWENPVGFGIWKVPASKNWDYFAASTGQHNPPSPGEAVSYGIYLYDSNGNLIWSKQIPEQLWGIDISPDGRYVAAGSMGPDAKLYLYDRVEDSLWTYYTGGDTREVKFSHDGRYLAVGPTVTGGSGSIGLFDVETHQLLWERDTGDWVREITFGPDDSYIAVGSSSGYLYVLNASDGSVLWKRFHGGYLPFILEISQDGSRIMIAGKSEEVYVFDRDGNLLWTYPTDHVVTDGRMSADGSIMVVGTIWGGIYCLDGDGNLLWRWVKPGGPGHNAVYMTKNGKYIAVGGQGITLLDNQGTILWQNESGSVNYVAVSEDGSKIIAGYEEPRVVRLYTRSGLGGAIAYNHSNIIPKDFSLKVPSNTPVSLIFKNFLFTLNSSKSLDLSLTVGSNVTMKRFLLSLEPEAPVSLAIKADVSPPLGVPALDNDIGIYVDMKTGATVAVRAILGLYVDETALEEELGRDIDVSRLTWMYWDGSRWVPVMSRINVDGYLTANTMHLSTWSVVEMIPLRVTVQLAPEEVIRGDTITMLASVKDDAGNTIAGATVKATIDDKVINLSDLGDGNYKGTFETADLKEGNYNVIVIAEKAGYEQAQLSRTLTIKAVIPLQMTVHLSSDTVTKGDSVKVSVILGDIEGNPIEGANVTATIDDEIIRFSDIGDGKYQGTIDTSNLREGTYNIVISAQKARYKPAQTSQRLIVKAMIPWMLYGGIIGVIITIIAVAFYLLKRRF